MRFRQLIFWLHLIAGLVAGVVIFIMSATGVVLAFEKEIIAWAERDVQHVIVPADTPRLDLDNLLERLREEHPGARPSTITLDSDANAEVLASVASGGALLLVWTGFALAWRRFLFPQR